MPISSSVRIGQLAAGAVRRFPWSLRLVLLLVASITLLLAMSGVATWNMRTQRIEGEWVAHSNQVRYELLRILQLLIDAETGAREVAHGSERALQAYREATPLIDPSIERLKQLVSDNAKQRALAAQIGELARDIDLLDASIVKEAGNGNNAKAQLAANEGHVDDVMAAARSLLAQMQVNEDHSVIERRVMRDRARRDANLALWGTGGLGAILLVLVVYFTRRDEARLHRAERELATTLRSIGDAVISTDVNGNILFMNPVAERLTGWTVASARGLPLAQIFQIMSEETRAPVDSPARRVLQEGKTVQLANHTLLKSRDGTERAIANSGAPIVGETGEIQGMVLIFRDVSETRHAERTLQLRDTELQIINDFARFPVARCDPQYRYLFVNKAYAERLGFEPAQCVGRHIREIAGEPAYERVRPYIEEALAGRVVEFETEIPYAGTVGARWMRCIYAPVRDDTGNVGSFVAAVTDITERKAAEMELERSQAALKETDRRKDEFIATLSHELRNPLAPIRTAAKLLASPALAPAQLQRARLIIERQVTHMALLLDDLLDIARITQGKLQLKKRSIALFEVVDAAVEAARPILDGKNHRLSVNLPSERVMLEVDPLRLSQILSNLLLNAAKYSDPGSSIALVADLQGEVLALSVKDDGIGIAPEFLPGIFDMFSQIEGVLGRSDGGLGIGLSLVKGLTELHGGTVEVLSQGVGHGSEFIVRLPISSCHGDTAACLPVPTPTSSTRRRILIVDDNQDAADSLGALMELSEHDVRIAYLGRTALLLAQTFRPEVVLLDIGMPDLSGYAVAGELRKASWATETTLIALTGWGQEHDRHRALTAGFDHHLTKPIDPDQLEALIHGLPRAG